ncbi:MAG: hypothetical protein E6H46_13210 [Betaproteobacteria bacterium]|nr:MAG: hypothetical protein E6H46_13210 [Betaproteobacteria bacterium]
MNDWQAAKRKACRHLGLPDHEALPGNEEVEQALRDYNTLFQGTAQMASLRAQRVDALDWIAVAAGWATEHSEVRLELEAEDTKSVELSLINAGIAYASVPAPRGDGQAQLRVESPQATIRLVIVSPQQRRNRPRRERGTSAEERLTSAQLRALLAGEGGL